MFVLSKKHKIIDDFKAISSPLANMAANTMVAMKINEDVHDYTVPTTDSSTMTRLSYKETLKRQQFVDAQKRLLNQPIDYDDPGTFQIDCERCYGNVPGIILTYRYNREIEYKHGQRMYCHSFVNSFLHLLSHDAHEWTPMYHAPNTRIQAAICIRPKELPTYIKELDKSVTNIVTIAYSNTHFVVINFGIKDRTIDVLDGLNYSIGLWKHHAVHILKEYDLVPVNATAKFEHVTGRKRKGDMWLDISFDDNSVYDWRMQNYHVVRQTDGVNCGPLACYRVLLMYGYEMYLCESTIKDVEEIRVIVMNHWNAMLKRQSKHMYSLKVGRNYEKMTQLMKAAEDSPMMTTTMTMTQGQKATEDTQVMKVAENSPMMRTIMTTTQGQKATEDDSPTVSSGVEAELATASGTTEDTYDHVARRNEAMEKRNARQEQLANKAMKQYSEGVKKLGVTSGAVVVLKVDFRIHYHAAGIPAVVYKAKETGGILAVCEHGVITSSGDNKDFWVPNDQYKVIARANETAPMSPELQQVREKIKNETYNYSDQRRISYAKYHDLLIAASSPTKRGRCSCKKGCKVKTCGCLKKAFTCHSGCGCNGNCKHDK